METTFAFFGPLLAGYHGVTASTIRTRSAASTDCRLPQPSKSRTTVASNSRRLLIGDDHVASAMCCGRNMKFTVASGEMPKLPALPKFGH